MSEHINGKTVLITGANRGIGKSLVDTFVAHGAGKVYAAVRGLDSAAPLVAEHGELVVPVAIDLGDPASISAAAAAAPDVDIVINNAGVLTTTMPLDENAISSLEFELKINLFGLIHMAQAFAPVLAANGGGAFVQINSVVSMKSFANFSTYSASKAAAYSMTQALRDVLGEGGTRVLSVHPGPIATDMGDSAGLTEIAEPASLVGEAVVEALASGAFHVWPDTMAKQIGAAYQSFAENVVEADMSEG
jgi:NAD(P)-dependent dehydrogenase (short-subunit alcohol dehydrogenase family)